MERIASNNFTLLCTGQTGAVYTTNGRGSVESVTTYAKQLGNDERLQSIEIVKRGFTLVELDFPHNMTEEALAHLKLRKDHVDTLSIFAAFAILLLMIIF